MKSMMNCNRFNYNLPTMKREMKKYGLPEPESYEERDSFKVIFKNISVAEISPYRKRVEAMCFST